MNHQQHQDHEDRHGWFTDHIAAYLAAGLDTSEQSRFEAHARECEACAAGLADARADEGRLRSALAGDAPAADFEDRLITSFRASASRPRFAVRAIHPFVRHAATAVAASLLVATVGYFGSRQLDARRVVSSHYDGWDFGGGDRKDLNWQNWNSPATQPASPARVGLAKDISGDGDLDSSASGESQLRASLQSDEIAKRSTTRDMIRTARQYIEQAKYREALGVVDQILVIDPNNDYAVGVRPLVEDRALANEQRKHKELGASDDKTAQAGEKLIPYNDILRYPDKWPELSEQRDKGVALERGELIIDQQAAVQLDRVLPEINFNQIAFSDVVEFLRDITQANIFVNWKALELAGIDRKTPVIAHFKNAKLSKALALIFDGMETRGVKLGFAIDEGVLTISTVEDLAKSTSVPTSQPATNAQDARAIIRTGTIEFEIDNFESSFEQIKKITEESRGYIGTVNSERLTNGKVRGTVTLRIPPDRTEDVIAKLRPLGQILRQNLTAEEVTRQIVDLTRQLETAQTMQQRLSDLSANSTTQPVKDRVAAEREAGEWRGKAEQAQSQIASLKNQVALATITVILNEKGLQGSALLIESESVELNAETEDVERARSDAITAIDAAKGRIVESSLKQFDAGQLAARVVAEVLPERAGEVVDRLKQLGKIARLDVQRSSSTAENRPAVPGSRIERKDTRIVASFYNLANVAPRVTSNVQLACEDVEAAYRAIGDRVIKASGRIISSNVSRQQSDHAVATIQFEVKSDQADAVLHDLRAMGAVMRLESTQNTDANNMTAAKRGFAVQLVSIASAAPRQVATKNLATGDVAAAYNALLDVAHKTKARIVVSKLEQTANQPASAWLDFEVRRDDVATIDSAIATAGDVIGGDVSVSTDSSNTLASKVQYKIALTSADQQPPRETTTLAIETREVDASAAAVAAAAGELGGRVIESNVASEASGRTTARVTIDVPMSKSADLIDRTKSRGLVRGGQSVRTAPAQGAGRLARARIDVTFATPDAIVGADAGLWATIRNGLSTSIAGLMWSLRMLVIGICLIAPWVIGVWGGWNIVQRVRRGRAVA